MDARFPKGAIGLAGGDLSNGETASKRMWGKPSAPSVDVGDWNLSSQRDSVVALDAGAMADLAWLARAPQPDFRTTWDSKSLHISLPSEIPLWR